MTIPWEKVLTHPLGLAGYALSLVFGSLAVLLRKRKSTEFRWAWPASYLLALVSVLGGLLLAYRQTGPSPGPPPSIAPASPTLKIDTIHQVGAGAAVAGVQGNVTITPSAAPSTADPSHGKPAPADRGVKKPQ